MTNKTALPYVRNFLKAFIITAVIKVLMDEYVFNKDFRFYSLVFYSTWMGLIMVWLYHRRKKHRPPGQDPEHTKNQPI